MVRVRKAAVSHEWKRDVAGAGATAWYDGRDATTAYGFGAGETSAYGVGAGLGMGLQAGQGAAATAFGNGARVLPVGGYLPKPCGGGIGCPGSVAGGAVEGIGKVPRKGPKYAMM